MDARQLTERAKSGSIPHAVILSGPEGCGGEALAETLAAAYLFGTENPERLKSCPDYDPMRPPYYVKEDPDGHEEAGVRTHIAALSTGGFSGKRRVMAFFDAHRMNAHCQNALLKVLEEPPDGVLFLLVGEEAGLLSTVRSRCHSFTVPPLSAEDAVRYCTARGAEEKAAKQAVMWGECYPDRSLAYCNADYALFREKGTECLEKALFGGSPYPVEAELLKQEVVPSAMKTESRNAILLAELWRSLEHGALLLKSAGTVPAGTAPREKKCAERLAQSFTIPQIQAMIENTDTAIIDMRRQPNGARIVDGLLAYLCKKEFRT